MQRGEGNRTGATEAMCKPFCGYSYVDDCTDPITYAPGGIMNTDDAIYLLYHTLFGDSLYPLN